MLDFVIANKVVILGALFAISEVMALSPGIASNGIFDFIYKALKSALGK